MRDVDGVTVEPGSRLVEIRRRSPEEQTDYFTRALAEMACDRAESRQEAERLRQRIRQLETAVGRVQAVLETEPALVELEDPFERGVWDGRARLAEQLRELVDAKPEVWLRAQIVSWIDWAHDVGMEHAEPDPCFDTRGLYRDETCRVREDASGRPITHVWRRQWMTRWRPGSLAEDGTLTREEIAGG